MDKIYIEKNGKFEQLSWKQVFDTDNIEGWLGHIENAFDIVKPTGYKYFTWNRYIYKVIGDSWKCTGLLQRDLGEEN